MKPLSRCACLLAFVFTGCLHAAPEAPLHITGVKQLFVDNYVISKAKNVSRVPGVVEKQNGARPVILADQLWEDPIRIGFYLSVAYDDDKFKMWYLAEMPGHRDVAERAATHTGVGYAESVDGLTWTKPLVGMYYDEIPGIEGTPPHIPTNIIHQGHGFSCYIDPTVPEGDPAKFKAAFDNEFDVSTDPDEDDLNETHIAYSADGISWQEYNDDKSVTSRAADTLNQILWDPISSRYMLVCREDLAGDVAKGEARGTRIMLHAPDNDLVNNPTGWDTEAILGWRKQWKKRQIHAASIWPIEDARVYLAFLYVMEGKLNKEYDQDAADLVTRHKDHVVNFYVVSSRDGVNWNYDTVYRKLPLIPRGDAGTWDKDGIHSVWMVPRGDVNYLFYCGMVERFGNGDSNATMGIGLATLRRDGFFRLLSSKDGWVVTKPMIVDGTGALTMNVDASGGSLIAEVLDESGAPIPGYAQADAQPISGVDSLAVSPSWNGHSDMSSLVGRTVRLKFYFSPNTSLYSFTVN